MTELKFKKIHNKAVLPKQMTDGSAGYDLTATECIKMQGSYIYRTGLSVEIPQGYVGLLFPRSSICAKNVRLSNSVGVIDSDYRGEISAVMDIINNCNTPYMEGERVAQLVIVPIPQFKPVFVDELSHTKRGYAGYGSTGS